MSDPESSDSPQVKFMRDWAEAFKKKDLDLIAKALHKDYRHTAYPRSIGRPEQTREEWLEHTTTLLSLWEDLERTWHSVTDIPGKVILHVTAKTKTTIGVDQTHESIIIAHIVTDEDGSLKLKQIEDFTDSKTYLDFVQAVAAAKAK